jgi:hypothetical protein
MISKFRQPGNRQPYPGGKGVMRFADLGGPGRDGLANTWAISA